MHHIPTFLLCHSFVLFLRMSAAGVWTTWSVRRAKPYADADDPTTNLLVANPAQVVGAPDGAAATVGGVLGSKPDLRHNDRRRTDQGRSIGVATTVAFLSAKQQISTMRPLQLGAVGGGSLMATGAAAQYAAPYNDGHFKASAASSDTAFKPTGIVPQQPPCRPTIGPTFLRSAAL